jgi:hypothetical protein
MKHSAKYYLIEQDMSRKKFIKKPLKFLVIISKRIEMAEAVLVRFIYTLIGKESLWPRGFWFHGICRKSEERH